MKKNYLPPKCRFFYLFLIAFSFSLMVSAQVKRNKNYEDYIYIYRDIAIEHMQTYNVPASITLAQGLLESGAGKSSLTQDSNNHFGIKCHNDWKGDKVYKADDTPSDCFRKYRKAEESFDDHSRFISQKKRYEFLFALDKTDYIGWCKGLQQAGYATDKAYANKLIKLIEDYQLYVYDTQVLVKGQYLVQDKKLTQPNYKHVPYRTYGLIYVIAQTGDSYESIASEFGFKTKEICKYNEVPDDFPLKSGDIVYFEKKKSKADSPYFDHVVQVGESMHSISQFYGIKVQNLYKMNKKDFAYVPEEGDVLKLR